MRLYFDTAYIAKCYLNEPGGEQVRELASNATALYSSAWCLAEMACVIHRNLRERMLDPSQAKTIRSQFLSDVQSGVWSLLPVTEMFLHRVEAFTATLSASVFLRAGDAVHLVAALGEGFTEIWTNDRQLGLAAPHAGLSGRAI